MRRLIATIFLGLPCPALAQAFDCEGSTPGWTLSMSASGAALHLLGRADMDLMHQTTAEGRDWPRAFTLIGERDTAIVLIEREDCNGLPYRAHLFTQRGQTPILLTGCCEARE